MRFIFNILIILTVSSFLFSCEGFKLKKTHKDQLIIHSDPKVFDHWGFISEELPFKQLSLIPDDETIVDF